jgi:tetratricopeptide (TPR) repeat protein
MNPRDPTTWLNLGNFERRGGQPDSALVDYRAATRADSSFALGYLAEIQLLRQNRRDAEAVDVYRRWLAAMPHEHATRLSAVQLLQTLGRSDEALVLAQEGLQAAPKDGAPHVVYGMALAGRGRTREALEHLRTGQSLFDDATERAQVEGLIGALRAKAPDSLRALFAEDSVRAAKSQAVRDSLATRHARSRGPGLAPGARIR